MFFLTALPCPTLNAPLYGNISCTRMVTGDSCSFTCDPGYSLNGSPQRECLPTSTWSGQPTLCDPMLCSPPGGPENGIVVLPCNSPGPLNREFMTTCTIQCSFGYLLEGPSSQTCVLIESTNTVEWTQAPKCTITGIGVVAVLILVTKILF